MLFTINLPNFVRIILELVLQVSSHLHFILKCLTLSLLFLQSWEFFVMVQELLGYPGVLLSPKLFCYPLFKRYFIVSNHLVQLHESYLHQFAFSKFTIL